MLPWEYNSIGFKCYRDGTSELCSGQTQSNPHLEEQVTRSYINEFRLRRRTLSFAESIAKTRAPHRRVDMPVTSGANVAGDVLPVQTWTSQGLYDSRRRTVSWAKQATLEREMRISALVVEGEAGQICVGSRPRQWQDKEPDAKYAQLEWESISNDS